MENEFVPYDVALAMKELGFGLSDNDYINSPFFYNEEGKFIFCETGIRRIYKDVQTHLGADTINDFEGYLITVDNSLDDFVLAPTYSQAFRWFREKYQLVGEFKYLESSVIKFVIKYLDGTLSDTSPYCKEYEEAELACLRRLIEIVKNKED